jgi:hypothetical protein
MIKRDYYGWYDAKAKNFRVSLFPADAPVRPSVAIETKAEVMALVMKKRANIHWWPPLPDKPISPPVNRDFA